MRTVRGVLGGIESEPWCCCRLWRSTSQFLPVNCPTRQRQTTRWLARSSTLRLGRPSTFDVQLGFFGRFLGSPATLTRNHVRGVPAGPMVFRSGRLVLTMVLLCLTEQFCEARHVEADAASGKPRLDFL